MNPDLAWAAGLFEGEGCISNPNRGNSVRLDLALHIRDIDVLRRFKRIVGTGKFYGPYNNNMVHWLAFGREVCCAVLLDLWPYLGKRRRARVLHFFPRFKHNKG